MIKLGKGVSKFPTILLIHESHTFRRDIRRMRDELTESQGKGIISGTGNHKQKFKKMFFENSGSPNFF